jgi:uncharacterized protein (DUF2147 family)
MLAIVAMSAFIAGPSFANDLPGLWKTPDGVTAEIAACPQSWCITLKTGRFAGKTIGHLKPAKGRFEGRITDPSNNKTYEGHAKVAGNTLKLSGCVVKVFCQTQTWTRLPAK